MENTFEAVYEEYFLGPRSLAANTVRKKAPYSTPQEVEDLVQEAAIRFWNGRLLEKHDPEKGTITGLVYVSVRSAVVDYLTKKSRQPTGALAVSLPESLEESEDFITSSIDPDIRPSDGAIDRLLDAEATIGRIREFIETQSPSRKAKMNAVLEASYEGYSTTEAGKIAGVTRATVHNYFKAFREALEV